MYFIFSAPPVSWTTYGTRLADSTQIAQDDDGFEIASVRGSLDMDDDDDDVGPKPPPYDRAPSTNGGLGVDKVNRSASPLPAPTPQRPIESETLFAVGAEDDDYDDDEDDDHHKGARRGD